MCAYNLFLSKVSWLFDYLPVIMFLPVAYPTFCEGKNFVPQLTSVLYTVYFLSVPPTLFLALFLPFLTVSSVPFHPGSARSGASTSFDGVQEYNPRKLF